MSITSSSLIRHPPANLWWRSVKWKMGPFPPLPSSWTQPHICLFPQRILIREYYTLVALIFQQIRTFLPYLAQKFHGQLLKIHAKWAGVRIFLGLGKMKWILPWRLRHSCKVALELCKSNVEGQEERGWEESIVNELWSLFRNYNMFHPQAFPPRLLMSSMRWDRIWEIYSLLTPRLSVCCEHLPQLCTSKFLQFQHHGAKDIGGSRRGRRKKLCNAKHAFNFNSHPSVWKSHGWFVFI